MAFVHHISIRVPWHDDQWRGLCARVHRTMVLASGPDTASRLGAPNATKGASASSSAAITCFSVNRFFFAASPLGQTQHRYRAR